MKAVQTLPIKEYCNKSGRCRDTNFKPHLFLLYILNMFVLTKTPYNLFKIAFDIGLT